MNKIGLIAGNRKFPLLFAQAARRKNYSVVAVAIKGEASIKLKSLVDKVYWLDLKEYNRMFSIFKAEGITKVIMAGQISPWRLFSRDVQSNSQIRELLAGISDMKAATIFSKIIIRLEQEGLKLLDSTTFIEESLPKEGVLTKKEPNSSEWEVIHFGFELAKAIAHLDIGQTVAVKNKAIVAVEGLEGTDNLIRRSGKIARGGFMVVKVSRPKQDMRFDIPVVGLNTVKTLIKARATCLGIEAGKTLFIDKEESLRLADKKGLVIVAL
ncbi:MAG: UDP-2,3-diacylglucosamine diphosphatase LpxI [Candidatus Omnitrophica bacterium]|nr:UDP-2,3-diacylglucosamine diphosphatase LpxI [Candidatus Omnitrophota bacterium]